MLVFLRLRVKDSYIWGVRDSYVLGLVSLRLGVRDSYVWRLVFLRLGLRILAFGD